MTPRRPSRPEPNTHHVSLVALPDATASTLFGLFDVMNAFTFMNELTATTGGRSLFRADIVGETSGSVDLASGVHVNVQRAIDTVDTTDIVIVPSVLLPSEGWKKGRYPALVDWLRRMHERGAVICSACSGIFLLAETGLFDGKDATVHFAYARAFSATYPTVVVHPERTLVIAGRREDLVSSGASTTWHDLTLYLIARYAGATTAQEVARMFALQWHQDGLSPYLIFEGKTSRTRSAASSAPTRRSTRSAGWQATRMRRSSGVSSGERPVWGRARTASATASPISLAPNVASARPSRRRCARRPWL